MKRHLFPLSLVLLASGCASLPGTNKIPPEESAALAQATSGTLFSLEPGYRPEDKRQKLYGFTIFGKTKLTESDTYLAAAEIAEAAKQWGGFIAYCFNPRQALRIKTEKGTFDYVICYECNQLYIYRDEKFVASLGASGTPEVLESILKKAKVPISKPD